MIYVIYCFWLSFYSFQSYEKNGKAIAVTANLILAEKKSTFFK